MSWFRFLPYPWLYHLLCTGLPVLVAPVPLCTNEIMTLNIFLCVWGVLTGIGTMLGSTYQSKWILVSALSVNHSLCIRLHLSINSVAWMYVYLTTGSIWMTCILNISAGVLIVCYCLRMAQGVALYRRISFMCNESLWPNKGFLFFLCLDLFFNFFWPYCCDLIFFMSINCSL